MAQKTNPISLRLKSTNKLWNSCWYGDYNYTLQLKQDCGIRLYIQNICQQAKIAEPVVFITRARQQVRTLFIMPKRQPIANTRPPSNAFGTGTGYAKGTESKEGKRGSVLSVSRPPWTTALLPLASKPSKESTLGIGSPAFSGVGGKSSAGTAFSGFPGIAAGARNAFPSKGQGNAFLPRKKERAQVAETALDDWFCKIFRPKTVSGFPISQRKHVPLCHSHSPLPEGHTPLPKGHTLFLRDRDGHRKEASSGNTLFPYLLLALFTGCSFFPRKTQAQGGLTNKREKGAFLFSQGTPALMDQGKKEERRKAIYALAVTMLSANSDRLLPLKADLTAQHRDGEWIWNKMRQVPHAIFPVAREGRAEPRVFQLSQSQSGIEVAPKRETVSNQSLGGVIGEKIISSNQGEQKVSNVSVEFNKHAVPFGQHKSPVAFPSAEHTSAKNSVPRKINQTISTIIPKLATQQVTSGVVFKNHLETFLFQQVQGGCKVHYLVCPSAHQNPLFLASQIVFSLQERVPFRRLKHRLMRECSKDQRIKGVRINCSGRVATRSKKAQKARSESIQWGQTSLNVFSDFVHFASKGALTPFGKIGVKVWICYK